MNQQNLKQKFVNEWNEINNDEIKMKVEVATKKRKMMDEIMMGIDEKDEEIEKLKKENETLKEKMASMKAYYLKELKVLPRRQIPVELMNELFAALPIENAFCLLAKMPNGIFVSNVQKMIIGIKEALRKNKWNEEDCGSGLIISDEGLVIKFSVPSNRWNSIRAILPIPKFNLNYINKPTITFYFEVQVLNKSYRYGTIHIGFCDQQFPLKDRTIGYWENSNSIGISNKAGIFIDGSDEKFGNDIEYFRKDNVGIGIIQKPHSMECFATFNGKLLGKIKLPKKFSELELFPAVTLYDASESIHANFGKEEWRFKEFKRVLE